ncbi:MAG: sortase [Candidatus Saccharimonadales bacterium]
MKSSGKKSSQSVVPLPSQTLLDTPPKREYLQPAQDAATEVIKTQIDAIYSKKAAEKATEPTPTTIDNLEPANPYERTHKQHPDPQAEQWKKYHSAWQDYYQKYYESYYNHHLNLAKQQIEVKAGVESDKPTERKAYFSEKNTLTVQEMADQQNTDEIVFDLRQKLLSKISGSTQKIRKSRHFVPILSGLFAVFVLVFMQYNQLLVANVVAYVSPGNIDPQNIIVDPAVNVKVTSDPKLIIPRINVDVPVIYNVGSDYASQMAAMQDGVAHFSIPGADAHPGEIGNAVIAGHSSNDLFDGGDYKFIFAQLEKLAVGDTIYANYKSTRYTYVITKKQVVGPSDVSKLVYKTTQPMLTLVTCTPLGTSLNRLLITAKQISPDPSKSTTPASTSAKKTTSIPGNSPTLIERLFGAN